MFISRRDKEENFFLEMQKKSLEELQALSGNLWTDFNVHDPGVTIMDATLYALMETQYQFEQNFESYLCHPKTGVLNYQEVGLLPEDELFDPSIVSASDYEWFFREHLEDIVDCNIKISNSRDYKIEIEVKKGADHETIKNQVFKLYHEHRNLCENLKFEDIQIEETSKHKRRQPKSNRLKMYPKQNPEHKKIHQIIQDNYHSLQHEFPNCYGLNKGALNSESSEERQAEVLQLKAYLLLFDFILSGVQQRTHQMHYLLKLSDEIPHPFSFDMDSNDMEMLINQTSLSETSIFKPEEFRKLKTGYFNFLDSLYGESSDFSSLFKNISLKERARIIRHYPQINKSRFKGINIPDAKNSISGVKCWLSLILGKERLHEEPLINTFSRHNLKLISDDLFYDNIKNIWKIEFIFPNDEFASEQFVVEEIPDLDISYNDRLFQKLKKHLNLFNHHIIFESFLQAGSVPSNYRIFVRNEYSYILIFKQPDRKEWISLGLFENKQILIKTVNYLWHFVHKINRESFGCYILEHNLLLSEEKYNDDQQLSVILSHPFIPSDQQVVFQDKLKERLPVHLTTHFYWLNAELLEEFEHLYFRWKQAWSRQDEEAIRIYSRKIKKLL